MHEDLMRKNDGKPRKILGAGRRGRSAALSDVTRRAMKSKNNEAEVATYPRVALFRDKTNKREERQ